MFVYVVSYCGNYLEWEAGCWGSGNGLGPTLPTYPYCHEGHGEEGGPSGLGSAAH